MKKIICLLCIAAVLTLSSCGELAKSINSILGVDDHDYAAEEAIGKPDLQGDAVKALSETAKALAYGAEIIPFSSFADVSDAYIDVVLNYLSSAYYSKYSSDRALLERFSEEYPELSLSLLIPAGDYENTVYRFFGGNKKAAVKSTAMYSYLGKIDAFMLVGQTPVSDVSVRALSAEETENTYRLSVSFSRDGRNSDVYEIIFRKRGEDEAYIWRFVKSNKVYPLGV
ncbi:MAG: hypothetical protein II777_05345 [Clostridia bacterium]|nr:hypothetical protein [Clostridia bacterium]